MRKYSSKTKRAVSGMLSVAMITSALLTDFTPPAFAGEGVPADTLAGASGSVTSNYIAANLNVNSGQEAAASNEAAFTELVLSQMEAVNSVSLYSNEELIGASNNDAEDSTTEDSSIEPDNLKELVDGLISEMDSITPAGDYDENGLAPTYHYITLNYSLIEKNAVWEGMTINDIWDKAPDTFIASYLTTLSVYTQEGNEDYFIALANPASLNGLGNAIYADFSNGNTEEPTVYNDQITFDAETGLIYIPKIFYYNESGEEVLRQLEAQVLVPYSFEDDTANISVTSESEIEGVTALTGKAETAALDVTVTVPVVDSVDADKISIEDLYVTVNNDRLPFDLTNGGGFYDQETGELTIAAAGNTVYAVDVQIREGAAEEALASVEEREILVASIGDLSGIIARDLPFYGDVNYATSAAGMKTLPGVEVTANGVVRGQTYTYSGAYEYVNNYSSANTDNASKIITTTAPYCYYYISGGVNAAVDGSNMGGVNADGTVTINNLSTGSTALLNTAKPDSTFNRIVSLPDNTSLTSSNGVGTLDWTCNITGNPTGYANFVALHCVASATSSTGVASGTGNLTIRVLYYKAATSTADGYMVFSITSPTAYTQAGCAVYKIKLPPPDDTPKDYYARFGINKVSSANSSTKLSAYFAYDISTSDPAKNKAGSVSLTTNLLPREKYAAGLGEAYANGTLTTTSVTSLLGSYFEGSFTTSTSGVGQISLNSETCTSLASCDGGPIYVTLAEVIPADGYVRRTGVWVLKITPSKDGAKYSTLDSVTYYSYNASTGGLNVGTSVSKTSYYFTITNTPESYYARIGFDKYEYNPDNTAGSRLSGAVIGIAGSEAQAQAGALMGGTSYASKTLTTSSSAAVYYNWTLGQGVTIKTLYAYEASAPNGYDRNDGYWKIVLQGTTDTSGAGTQIISATYYDYSSVTKKWGSYPLSTGVHYNQNRGWYTQGSDSVIPVIHVTDRKLITYSVEKLFANDGTKAAVTSVTAELYRNGTATGKTITLNAGNNWKYTWTGLDKYDGNGKAYTYTVKEIKVNGSSNLSGYTVTYDNSKASVTTITNKLSGTVSYSVEKKFANAGTKSAVTSVTAELYRNGTATGKTVVLNAANNWKYTWTGLDKYDGNGKAYIYTVKEIKVNGSSDLSGYTVTYDSSKAGITTITNEIAGRPELPVTGGFGTTIFYIIAVLGLIAAAIFFFKGKKAGGHGKR